MMYCRPVFRLALCCSVVLTAFGLTSSIFHPIGNVSAGEPAAHPLDVMVDYAISRRDFIRENVRDYTCWLVKRERIGSELQDQQFAQLNVRCEQKEGDQVVVPLSVFMRFAKPSAVRDRRILFVDGKNNNEVLVRKGGTLLGDVQLSIDPHGTVARRESNYPITEVGFDQIMERLIELARHAIQHDPEAENTMVSFFENAKVGDRACTRIQIEHPQQAEGLVFHKAHLFVDSELRIPIRLAVYDWPEFEGDEPQLFEEYTYLKLALNVGLKDSDFDEGLLRD
jgi:hypothetical protein